MRSAKVVFGLAVCTTIILIMVFSNIAFTQCLKLIPPDRAYCIYYHNPGPELIPNSLQDYDMDIAEYRYFLEEFNAFLYPADTPVIGDDFSTNCQEETYVTHGEVVENYFEYIYERQQTEHVDNSVPWHEMVNFIAENYNEGTVANLSTGTLRWMDENNEAILNAYNAGVLLVGPIPVFDEAPVELQDKVLLSNVITATGEFIGAAEGTLETPNIAMVCVATEWVDEVTYPLPVSLISKPQPYYYTKNNAYRQLGSFTSPLLAGAVQNIADVVASRTTLQGGNFVQKVLDYAISACDRNDDSESYEHHDATVLECFGPWSPNWGYGVFNAWKALIYAYGFGILEAKDSEFDSEVDNPPTVFSDHFYLRGDLFVPAGQMFRVSPLATVSIARNAPAPEGPNDLGLIPSLHEIHVAGTMEVETSLRVPGFVIPKKGVNVSLTIDSGGSCTIKNGGLVQISSGQVLYVLAGGELNLEMGGNIIIEDGGSLIIYGDFNHAGTLALNPGSELRFGENSNVYLNTDVYIPVGAYFQSLSNSIITMASEDIVGVGEDPNRVEIICEGRISFWGNNKFSPVIVEGEGIGSNVWVGIVLNSNDVPGSCFNCVQISGADIGLNISGDANVYINNVVITECGTGLMVTGKSGYEIYLSGGEVSNCSRGVELNLSSINMAGMSIHNNGDGIRCVISSPKIHNCDIYANDIGIITMDKNSIPNLGSVGDAGNNDFEGSPPQLNDIHISAMDPESDIYAQENWWGTTNPIEIEAKILMVDLPPPGAGTVLYQPFLTEKPLGDTPHGPDKDQDPKKPVAGMPLVTYLGQNYPNPFNPATTIEYAIINDSHVHLAIYNVNGQLVRTLVNEFKTRNVYQKFWDGKNNYGMPVPGGVYFYCLTAGKQTISRKMVLIR